MTPAARVAYHKTLWPAACRAQGWNARDDALRREVALQVMAEVRGPAVTTSSPEFGLAETTALFVFLHQQANPNDLVAMEEWLKCKDDYVTYNQARQADWHERQAYGQQGSGKLQRNRFARARTAAAGPLDELDPKTVQQRLLTMRSRNEQRTGYQRKRPARENAIVPQPITPPAASSEADLEKHNCAW
jgi:hypothetical protein